MDPYKPPPPIVPDDQSESVIDRFLRWLDQGSARMTPMTLLVITLMISGIIAVTLAVIGATLWLLTSLLPLVDFTDELP